MSVTLLLAITYLYRFLFSVLILLLFSQLDVEDDRDDVVEDDNDEVTVMADTSITNKSKKKKKKKKKPRTDEPKLNMVKYNSVISN